MFEFKSCILNNKLGIQRFDQNMHAKIDCALNWVYAPNSILNKQNLVRYTSKFDQVS